MTHRERHTQYVNDMNVLADNDGTKLVQATQKQLAKVFEKADGNLELLIMLMEESKDIILPQSVMLAKGTMQKAATLGRNFGTSKTRLVEEKQDAV
jgi:hypothetical protein